MYDMDNIGQYVNNQLDTAYTFTIKSLKMVPSRDEGYNDMFIRPYVSKVSYNDVERITDNFVKTGKFNNEENNLIGISQGIVAKAGITGGWKSKRYTFKLEVSCVSNRSLTKHDLILEGYTDPTLGFKVNHYSNDINSYDKELVFHINSCKKLDLDNLGRLISINDLGIMDDGSVDNNITRSLRPSDVITNIQLKELSNEFGGRSEYANNSVDRYNVTFDRKHNSSGQYMSSIFGAITKNCENSTNNDVMINSAYRRKTNSILHGTATELSNMSIHNVSFIKLLNSSMFSPGYNKFNLNTIMAVCPTFHPACIMCVDIDDKPMFESGSFLTAPSDYTMQYHSLDPYTPIMQDIHNLLVNFMVANFIGHIDLTVHNIRGPEEMPFNKPTVKYIINNIAFIQAQAIEQEQVVMGVINANLNNICRSIDGYLNKNNMNVQYQIALNMSMGLDSNIQVQIQGIDANGNLESNECRIYRFPTFADMNFTPMAGNVNNMDQLSSDIEQVVHAMQELI